MVCAHGFVEQRATVIREQQLQRESRPSARRKEPAKRRRSIVVTINEAIGALPRGHVVSDGEIATTYFRQILIESRT